MNKYMQYLGLIILFFGCQSEEVSAIRKEFNDDSFAYQIIKEDSVMAQIGFTKEGELDYFANFPFEDAEQRIYFFLETGVIKSKLKYDRENRAIDRAYYFYDTTGNLNSHYYYDKGISVGSAVSYFDTLDRVKSVMLYNNKGELYYRKTFDEFGNHVKTEGSKE